MQPQRSVIPYDAGSHTAGQTKASWSRAYMRFLFSSDESLLLKAAPLAMLGILPLDLVSNLVPVIGELDDLGYIIALVFIAARTADRVRKYR